MYITGLDGQARRMYTYSEATGFGAIEYAFIYWCRYHGNCVSLYLFTIFIRVFVTLQEILVVIHGMHVHLNGLLILQYQNITLQLHHKLIQVNHSGMLRKMDMNYSQVN